MAVILRYLTTFGKNLGPTTSIKVVEIRPQNIAQRSSFWQYVIYGDTSEATEKECVKKDLPPLEAIIRLVQHCAAISAIAELLLSVCSYKQATLDVMTMIEKSYIFQCFFP